MNNDNINNNDETPEENAVNTGSDTEANAAPDAPAANGVNDSEFDEDDDFEAEPLESSADEDASEIDLPLNLEENDDSMEDIVPLSRRAMREAKRNASLSKAFSNITKTKAFKICMVFLAAVLTAAIAVYAACIVTLPTNTVARNVFVEDIDVSGLSYSEALALIEKNYLLENQKITLTCGIKSYDIDGANVALTASPIDTAKLAYKYGKSGNMFADGFTAFTLLFHNHTIVPSASFDEEKMREAITDFGNQAFGERKNHYVEIGDGKAIVWPGQTGFDGNIDVPLAEVTEAVKNGKLKNISVTLASAPPKDLTLEDFDASVYADPVDAHFEIVDNEVKVVNETNGRYINKEEAAALIPNVKEGGEPVEIPFYYSYPSVLSADLNGKLFANTMASYSTSYASSGSNRASNVARAASLINGKILMPGDVFSFNDTVGRRTVANGFKTAPEYVDGKTVDGIGGGTCQVSSTLYNAVLYADLEIVTRTNHMFTVAYVANGQDATVADSGPDFKFKNNSPYPIKISAYTGGGQITVAIIGTNYEPKHEVKINNSTSYSNNGDTHVKTTRTVYANGEVIKSESLPSSTYRKHVEETAAPAAAQAPANEAQAVSAPAVQEVPVVHSPSSDENASGGNSENNNTNNSEDLQSADNSGASDE